MGLADYFSKEGGRPQPQKMIQRASDKHAQSPIVFAPLNFCVTTEVPTPSSDCSAASASCMTKPSKTSRKKEWVYHELVAMGAKVLSPLRKYMRESETLWMGSQSAGTGRQRG